MTLPGGVHAIRYEQDQALIRTKPQWCWFFALMIFLLTVPFFGGGEILGFLIVTWITLISVVGLQINVGFAGQINMGQSAFMGVGAYTAGAMSVHWDLPIWITIPAAGMASACFGAVFGLAAVRVKGFYLALTTIAAQYVFVFVMSKMPQSWFGKSEGLRLDMISLFGFKFSSDISLYYLFAVIGTVMIYGAWGMVRSRTGRALVAVRDNDNAAEIIGIDVFYYKALSFFIGAFYAGVAGALWAYYVRYVQADMFTLFFSVWYLGMLIVGGLGSILGAIIGTVAIRLAQEAITYIGPWIAELDILAGVGGQVVFAAMNMLLGGVIILFVIFEPRGLVHRWNIIKESWRIRPFPH